MFCLEKAKYLADFQEKWVMSQENTAKVRNDRDPLMRSRPQCRPLKILLWEIRNLRVCLSPFIGRKARQKDMTKNQIIVALVQRPPNWCFSSFCAHYSDLQSESQSWSWTPGKQHRHWSLPEVGRIEQVNEFVALGKVLEIVDRATPCASLQSYKSPWKTIRWCVLDSIPGYTGGCGKILSWILDLEGNYS